MFSLLITLGHNSSAIGIRDGNIIAAYEEERFTRNKSELKFPYNAIGKILDLAKPSLSENNIVMISHWFDAWNINASRVPLPFYDEEYINNLRKKFHFEMLFVSPDCTHHDAHVYSVIAFAKNNMSEEDKYLKWHAIVSDGFGNQQEVMSVYEIDMTKRNPAVSCIQKIYGYTKSLGLLYQFATTYCDMKENQDEYKFLGYETLILDCVTNEQLKKIDYYIEEFSDNYINEMANHNYREGLTSTCFINLDQFELARNLFIEFYSNVLATAFPNSNLSKCDRRVIVGYAVQSIIEQVHHHLINKYKIKNMMLAGGLYYNVKLNNEILNNISGKLCVVPVAGDQVAAIGLYEKYVGHYPFASLLWGKRNISPESKVHLISTAQASNIHCPQTEEELIEIVTNNLLNDHVINIVTANMEFGPRALCNTSTLTLPTTANVNLINSINKRDTIMPMAPVMSRLHTNHFFDESETKRVIGSDQYMILTYNYLDSIQTNEFCKYSGIMHKHPIRHNTVTGRPQIVPNEYGYINSVLAALDTHNTRALINTSFNVHGEPIVYSAKDALNSFSMQLKEAQLNNIDTKSVHLVLF